MLFINEFKSKTKFLILALSLFCVNQSIFAGFLNCDTQDEFERKLKFTSSYTEVKSSDALAINTQEDDKRSNIFLSHSTKKLYDPFFLKQFPQARAAIEKNMSIVRNNQDHYKLRMRDEAIAHERLTTARKFASKLAESRVPSDEALDQIKDHLYNAREAIRKQRREERRQRGEPMKDERYQAPPIPDKVSSDFKMYYIPEDEAETAATSTTSYSSGRTKQQNDMIVAINNGDITYIQEHLNDFTPNETIPLREGDKTLREIAEYNYLNAGDHRTYAPIFDLVCSWEEGIIAEEERLAAAAQAQRAVAHRNVELINKINQGLRSEKRRGNPPFFAMNPNDTNFTLLDDRRLDKSKKEFSINSAELKSNGILEFVILVAGDYYCVTTPYETGTTPVGKSFFNRVFLNRSN